MGLRVLSLQSNPPLLFTQRLVLKLLITNSLKKDSLNQESKFSNRRFIRNLFEEMIMKQARRLATNVDPTIEDLKTLYPADFSITNQNSKEQNLL